MSHRPKIQRLKELCRFDRGPRDNSEAPAEEVAAEEAAAEEAAADEVRSGATLISAASWGLAVAVFSCGW